MILLLNGTIISLCISIGIVEGDRKWAQVGKMNLFQIIIVFITLLGASVIPTVFIVLAIAASFRRDTRRQMLGVVLVAYFSCAVVFAGIYYQYEGMKLSTHLINHVTPYKGHRAFTGIDANLWTNIEDDVPDIATAYNDSPERLMAIVGEHARSLQFQSQNRLDVFLDCFHFSIMTITTVGYGDIAPHERVAEFASEAEVLTGITLFVVALGMVFGNWWPEKPTDGPPRGSVEAIMAEALKDPT
jgi:hypothetical protein